MASDSLKYTKSVLSRPVLGLSLVVVLMASGIGLGALYPRTYSAESRVLVGQLSVSAQAVPGVVSANNNLAETYARLVETSEFGERLGAAEGDGRTITATPIINSPIVRMVASADNAQAAAEYANAAAEELRTYVDELNTTSSSSELTLTQYQQARSELAEAEASLANAADGEGVSELEAAVETAQLEVDALANRFENEISESQRLAGVTVLTLADDPVDSRPRMMMLAGAAGALAGIVLAVALAVRRVHLASRDSAVTTSG